MRPPNNLSARTATKLEVLTDITPNWADIAIVIRPDQGVDKGHGVDYGKPEDN
jgi:hypothetical protein